MGTKKAHQSWQRGASSSRGVRDSWSPASAPYIIFFLPLRSAKSGAASCPEGTEAYKKQLQRLVSLYYPVLNYAYCYTVQVAV